MKTAWGNVGATTGAWYGTGSSTFVRGLTGPVGRQFPRSVSAARPEASWAKFLMITETYQFWIVILTALGVAAAGGVLFVYAGQWYAMRRQLDQMARQAGVMEAQSLHMEAGLTLTREAAEAAKKSALVAERTLIMTERANIQISDFKARINRVPNGPAWMQGTFEVVNHGRLSALINRVDVSEAKYGYKRPPISEFSLQSGERGGEMVQAFGFQITEGRDVTTPIEVIVEVEYLDRFKRRVIRFGWYSHDITDTPQWRKSFGRGFNHETEFDLDEQSSN